MNGLGGLGGWGRRWNRRGLGSGECGADEVGTGLEASPF
jgi:hypothetical protein